MSFSATVDLGIVGAGITTVSLSRCDNSSCTSGTPLVGYSNVAVSSFPIVLTGLPYGTTHIKADAVGACSGMTQCLSIIGIPTPTPTPTPSPTTSPTPTPTPTASSTPTPTPTATGAPAATATPTPTATGVSGVCYTGDGIATGSCGTSDTATFTLLADSSVIVLPGGFFFTGSGTRGGTAYLKQGGSTIQTFSMTQFNSNSPVFSPTGYTLSTAGTYTLEVNGLDCSNGSGTMKLELTGCTTTASPTPTATAGPGATATPTPTPSATAPGLAFGIITGTTFNFSGDACNQFESSINKTLYLNNDSTPNFGDVLYTTQECSFGSEYAGDGSVYWYFLYRMGVKYAVKIGSGGTISDVVTCGAMSTSTPTPTPTPTATTEPVYLRYISSGAATSVAHCGNNYVTSMEIRNVSSTISGMMGTLVRDQNDDPFNGGGLYYAVSTDQLFNTNNPPYDVIKIDPYGYVETIITLTSCSGGGGEV